jgi:hypothetical protein
LASWYQWQGKTQLLLKDMAASMDACAAFRACAIDGGAKEQPPPAMLVKLKRDIKGYHDGAAMRPRREGIDLGLAGRAMIFVSRSPPCGFEGDSHGRWTHIRMRPRRQPGYYVLDRWARADTFFDMRRRKWSLCVRLRQAAGDAQRITKIQVKGWCGLLPDNLHAGPPCPCGLRQVLGLMPPSHLRGHSHPCRPCSAHQTVVLTGFHGCRSVFPPAQNNYFLCS